MKRNAAQQGRTMRMEWLEPRLLLAADIALAGGVLTVTRTSGNDAIEVREVGTWDGTSLSVSIKDNTTGAVVLSGKLPKEAVQCLVFSGLAGNDTSLSACGSNSVAHASGYE